MNNTRIFQPCHWACAFPFDFIKLQTVLLLIAQDGRKLEGPPGQSNTRTKNVADIRYRNSGACRIELELPSMGFVGPSAVAGENPPLVLELELFRNITCLESRP